MVPDLFVPKEEHIPCKFLPKKEQVGRYLAISIVASPWDRMDQWRKLLNNKFHATVRDYIAVNSLDQLSTDRP